MTDRLADQRPFAVFDIDGTIIRWQLYHAIADALAKGGHIDATAFERARQARMQWKKRAGQDAFKDYEEILVGIYDDALATLDADDLMAAIQRVFDEYKEQTYTYTRDLIADLKGRGYLLFAISASQEEIVEMLARYYGFDAWAGSTYAREGKRFTGEKTPLKRDLKVKTLSGFVERFGATRQGSIAVGDSDSDIPMLENVERPIAFNPNKLLFDHAKRQGWKIVLERKNMVYELEPEDDGYRLL
ncbi:MAG TPA: HAD-IB family hydrolase [Candidatus Saccharimonadales bacterium]|nr:HAD-IB family hydrolase [Candidatus Saccharimonadales bacterium]